ncbi:hypothetical protein SAMN06265350_103346 [Solitalea koreensis]|uniref:Uncharacterized protein n=1 Tax=Solitalea koreensis TaxID=543615 RepID=A0A521CA60_9SPHI|nr:hypothetical protein SAMN06265350_103346 [Solitalea koreensis]
MKVMFMNVRETILNFSNDNIDLLKSNWTKRLKNRILLLIY